MNERRGSRPLVGREKKTQASEMHGQRSGLAVDGIREEGSVVASPWHRHGHHEKCERVDHQCREMTSHLSVGLEQCFAT